MSRTDTRVAVVTGGSQGIGAAIVAAYRQRGWAVVANSRSIRPSDDGDLITVDGDLAEIETTDRIVDEAVERFGRVDTLVNNAGVFVVETVHGLHGRRVRARGRRQPHGILHAHAARDRRDAEARRRPRRQHHNHTRRLCELRLPSVLTSLTKGGVASATKSLAIEYASRGIRVNAVSPGVIQTPVHAPETYDDLAGSQPLGHVGQVGDIVAGIMFLESSPFITGEILHIDGGQIAGR